MIFILKKRKCSNALLHNLTTTITGSNVLHLSLANVGSSSFIRFTPK